MSHRDPRITPISGDVLRSGTDGRERHVTGVYNDSEVSYRSTGGRLDTRNVCQLKAWQSWCAHENAEVNTLTKVFDAQASPAPKRGFLHFGLASAW